MMEDTQHTPGPWEVQPLGMHEGGEGIEIIGSNGETVCDNQTYYPHALDPKNARLIAAAPDMLEALKKVQETIAMWRDSKYSDGAIEGLKYNVVDEAIAKATGKQP